MMKPTTIRTLCLAVLFGCSELPATPEQLIAKPLVAHSAVVKNEPLEQTAAWDPQTAQPTEKSCATDAHSTEISVLWEPVSSMEALVTRAEVIVQAHVVGRSYDALRSYDNPKDSAPERDARGELVHADVPMTLIRYSVDAVIAGSELPVGTSLEALFAGGLLANGCLIEPADNPLPVLGDRDLLFLRPLGANQLVKSRELEHLFGVVGAQGRVNIENDRVKVPSRSESHSARWLQAWDGSSIAQLEAEIQSLLSMPPLDQSPVLQR